MRKFARNCMSELQSVFSGLNMRLTLCSSSVSGFASARTERRVRISPQATKCEMIIVRMLQCSWCQWRRSVV